MCQNTLEISLFDQVGNPSGLYDLLNAQVFSLFSEKGGFFMQQPSHRTILHCDCNGFYASVECLLRPELRNIPMAVCGDPENRHGIILAKNELAKKYKIQTAETIWQARRKCPDLTLVPPHMEEYQKYSRLANAIYQSYTDLVESFGIDESWLDVTGSLHLFGTGKQIADTLRQRIRSELGLTISVGVSFNKIFAKLGSDYKKPDATTVISPENFRDIVFPLPVSDLLFVGKSAVDSLAHMGIHTIGELAAFDRNLLAKHFGKNGEILFDYANGLDNSPVRPYFERPEAKSIGNHLTFRRNLVGIDDLKLGVFTLADSVAARLRKHGLKCYTVQVTIKNPSLKVISRQQTLVSPTWLSKVIASTAMDIIQASWNLNAPVRMLSVTATHLIPASEATEQLSLFSGGEQLEKQEHLESTLDEIRRKFGHDAVSIAGALHNDIGLRHSHRE